MPWFTPGVRVTREFLHLDDETRLTELGIGEHTIDYSSTADQGAKFQEILDFAAAAPGANGAIVLAGDIYTAQQIEMPTGNITPIYGVGRDRSSLRLTPDLGPGKYALKLGGTEYDLRDFRVAGPGGAVQKDGAMIAQCAGLFTRGRGIMTNIGVAGFGKGIELTNDHQEFHSVDMRGNAIAMDLIDNPAGGLGDQYWERCHFTSNNRASLALCDTASLTNARLIQGHIGGPYGIWRYPAGTITAIGENDSPTLTNVAIPPWFPIGSLDGLTVAGRNIPPGTTVLFHTGSGFNFTLTLSANATGVVSNIYFPLHQYAATGSVAAGAVLTNVNIPDIVEMASAELGVEVQGPNIPAGTTITDVAGVPGNYTLTLSQAVTGNVVAMTFKPRGTTLSGVIFENHSFEYCSHAAAYDMGRTRGTWTNLTFDSPGEYGTGEGSEWPGMPRAANGDLMANFDVGDIAGWHWRDNFIAPNISNANQPYLNADSINDVLIDLPKAPSTFKMFRVRAGSNVNNVQSGRRGGPGAGNAHTQWAVAHEAITQGALLETVTVGSKVQESRNGAGSLFCGFSCANYNAGDVVMMITQYENTSALVKNHATSPTIAQNALIKPDPANQGCVVAASSYTDGPILGRVNDAAILAGTTGRAQVRIP